MSIYKKFTLYQMSCIPLLILVLTIQVSYLTCWAYPLPMQNGQ